MSNVPAAGLAGDFSCTSCGAFLDPKDTRAEAVDGRFYIAQFTVNEDESIAGSFNLMLVDGTVLLDRAFGSAPCPPDLDDDRRVGVSDLLAVLAAWGGVGGPEDLDDSGLVDFGDVLVVLDAWGECPL